MKRLLATLLLFCGSAVAQLYPGGGAGVVPGSNCGDATHALSWNGSSYGCQAITGGAAAGGSNTQIQYNNATAEGGISGWTTNGTTTITGAASSVLDLSAMAPISGLKLPTVAGAVPTADGFIGINSTLHALVTGSNGTTIVHAAAGVGTNASTTCTNQVFTVISAVAAPTCTTLSTSFLPATAVNSVTNDTNITGSISAQALTLGFTGTLAKARIIATAVYNDQSNTFSTGTQDFSAATLLKARVGATLTTSVNGDIGYDTTNKNWHVWQNAADSFLFSGPVSGTYTNGDCIKFGVAAGVVTLVDNGAACGSGGSTVWSSLTAPSGSLALSMAGNTSTFNTTTALSQMFAWKNTTAAIVGTSQGSPVLALCGRAFHGSADVEDCLTLGELPGNGNDAAITFTVGHTGTSTGTVSTQFPGPVISGASGSGAGAQLGGPEGTTAAGAASSDFCQSDSTLHGFKCSFNADGPFAMTRTIVSGTSAMGTSAISSGTCATVVTTSATGTATTDVVPWGFNADPTAVTGYSPTVNGMLTIIAYPTANNVNFKVCNNTNASITPGAITLNWRIVR